jgi:glycosyltransferase involved in cell wall biosynthesis
MVEKVLFSARNADISIPKVSIIIPYFNSAQTILRTVNSTQNRLLPELEIIIVDDGSENFPLETTVLGSAVLGKNILTFALKKNMGKAAACNYAFSHTTGGVIIVLDSDDELSPNWDMKLLNLHKNWLANSPLAFAHTVTENMESTGRAEGLFSREQWLNGECRGEYLPIFRGDVARSQGYVELGCRDICGPLSYSRILENGPLYIHPEVMRIYYTGTASSLSKDLFRSDKAKDTYLCFHAARVHIENYDREKCGYRRQYICGLYLREAVYKIFGEGRLKGLAFAVANYREFGIKNLLIVSLITFMPRFLFTTFVSVAKRISWLPKFG